MKKLISWCRAKFSSSPPAGIGTPEDRTFLLRGLAELFRLPLKAADAQAMLDRSTSMPLFFEQLQELGLESSVVDLRLVTPEQMRRGPILLWLDRPAPVAPPQLPFDGTHSTAPLLPASPAPATSQVAALLVRIDDGTAQVVTAGAAALEGIPLDELAYRAKGQAIQVSKNESEDETGEKFGWKWFSNAFFQNKTAIRDALVASLAIQLIALAFPLATQAIVDKVITNQAVNTLAVLGIGIVIMAIFSGILTWIRQRLMLGLANAVDTKLAQRVLDHLFRLPLPFFEKRPTGVLINRIHGIERVREFFAGAFLLAALELPFMFIFLALMVSYSFALSGVVLGFLAVMSILSFAVGPKLRERVNDQTQLGAKLQGFMAEHVAASETVKSLQLEPYIGKRFAEINQAYLGATLATRQLGNTYGTLMQVLEQLMNVSVLCLGAYLAMQPGSGLTIGMLVAFQMFAQRVSQPILKLSGYWQELQQVRVAVGMLGELMLHPAERYSPLASSVGQGTGRLEVQGLSFRYSPDLPPLYEDFNLTVEPGQVVLVTGPSGSGKSTLAKVLLGLYPWYGGTVKVDGRDTRSMSINELRSHFGVVPQEAVLFSGSLLHNLINGVPGATLAHAVHACKQAGIHETIENLPNGYQTVVGERGVGLSGGQRQRVAIARALMKNPHVLVFDESTSGLDEASAERVAATVNSLRGKVSMLFIAHKIPANLKPDSHVDLKPTKSSTAIQMAA